MRAATFQLTIDPTSPPRRFGCSLRFSLKTQGVRRRVGVEVGPQRCGTPGRNGTHCESLLCQSGHRTSFSRCSTAARLENVCDDRVSSFIHQCTFPDTFLVRRAKLIESHGNQRLPQLCGGRFSRAHFHAAKTVYSLILVAADWGHAGCDARGRADREQPGPGFQSTAVKHDRAL